MGGIPLVQTEENGDYWEPHAGLVNEATHIAYAIQESARRDRIVRAAEALAGVDDTEQPIWAELRELRAAVAAGRETT